MQCRNRRLDFRHAGPKVLSFEPRRHWNKRRKIFASDLALPRLDRNLCD